MILFLWEPPVKKIIITFGGSPYNLGECFPLINVKNQEDEWYSLKYVSYKLVERGPRESLQINFPGSGMFRNCFLETFLIAYLYLFYACFTGFNFFSAFTLSTQSFRKANLLFPPVLLLDSNTLSLKHGWKKQFKKYPQFTVFLGHSI